jgi:signal transduction histidine kinase
MTRIRLRPWLEPAVGLVFLGAWVARILRWQANGQLVNVDAVRFGLVASVILLTLAIGFARVRPALALLLIGALLALQAAFWFVRDIDDGQLYLGVPIVVFFVAAHSRGATRRLAPIAVALISIGVAALLAIPVLSIDRVGWTSADYTMYVDLFRELPPNDWASPAAVTQTFFLVLALVAAAVAIAWFLGAGFRAWLLQRYGDAALVRTRKELRAAEVAVAVGRERDRISQDVHDIMAHSLSVILAQADGARYAGGARPEITTESLANISDTARASLTEVRRLIESLGPDPEPHIGPGLDDVEKLLERMRAAGLAVTFSTFGDALVTDDRVSRVIFRLLQESLTNALKHAGDAAQAQVAVAWHDAGLTLKVSSQGDGRRDSIHLHTGGAGRGILGMRERVHELGGWLAAESDDEDPRRFIVTAFIPAESTSVPWRTARQREDAMP